jgi:hypothetical protein
MKIIRCLAVLFILAISLMPLGVMAAGSVTVVITATPMFSAGITSFTVTYIEDAQMDLDWTVDATVDLVMIRSSYNGYPADIPDEDTAPSDGNLVYYGDLLHFSDTSMNFDENLGTIYYKAWAQKPDGHWYVATSTGSKESEVVTLILLFGFGVVLSYIAIRTKEQMTALVLAFVASAIWLTCIIYTRANPIGNMTTGDNADNAILVALIALMVLVPVITWRVKRSENEKVTREDTYKRAALPKDFMIKRESASESYDEYFERLNRLTKRK